MWKSRGGEMIYIGIVGSRKRSAKEKIKKILEDYIEFYNRKEITVVSGGADGIDNDAQWACKKLGLKILIIYPNRNDYKYKGNTIFFERNEEIAEISEYMITFPLNRKGGTMNTIKHFINLGKRNRLVIID